MRITEDYQRETIAAIRELGTPLNDLPDGYIAELYARWSEDVHRAGWLGYWGDETVATKVRTAFTEWALKEI